MQAQPNTVIVNAQTEEGLIELDLQSLVHVGGGAPKGTWLVGADATATVALASLDAGMEPAPKGTW
ncbi:hypothetical protein CDN99_23165 [Roseateles aquatilis]|uniref:Uncharacterized protein n=1 Tax=Roseateles aquatilis TaxID=431061 RepID=A0A246IYF3_9BURK|nr:hypothetical protein [Roseateles aquatilis]OWQ85107.1 hypothetical protein CDN99_23165 [Roseateles aquatilis]